MIVAVGFNPALGSRRQSPTRRSLPLLPGSGRNDDLADVWFERRGSSSKKQPQRRKGELMPRRQKRDDAAQQQQRRQQRRRDVRQW